MCVATVAAETIYLYSLGTEKRLIVCCVLCVMWRLQYYM